MTRRPLPPCRPGFTDHVFKTAHGVDLPLRLWAAPPGSVRRRGGVPWVLWIHGGEYPLSNTPSPPPPHSPQLTPGGYTAGKWSAPTAWVTRAFGDHGYAIASIGYRQQPQASMVDMLADCVDAASWCQANLPSLVGADPSAWVVAGSSGGGSLACLVAHHTHPRVLVDVYGAPNAADDYHHNPHRKVAVEPYYVADECELADMLADRDKRNAITQSPWAYEIPPAVPLEETRAALGMPDFLPLREHFARNDLWSYVAKHRLLMPTVCRREDFKTQREYWSHVTSLSSYHLLDGKSRADYPPTFIMHGTADTDVRIEQSWEFGDKLRRMGIPVGEAFPEGKGHMFDFDLIVSARSGQGWGGGERGERGGEWRTKLSERRGGGQSWEQRFGGQRWTSRR